MRSKFTWLTALLWLAVAPAATSDEALRTDARVESVALFKNGMGFFTARVELPAGGTTIEVGQLPVASLGTFWVGYPDDVELRSVVATVSESTRPVPLERMTDLLRLNPGRRVRVHTRSGTDPVIEGTLVAQPDRPVPRRTNPYFMGEYDERPGVRPIAPPASSLILLETDDGLVSLTDDEVTRVDFGDGPVVSTDTTSSRRPSIRIELERPAGGKTLDLTWIAKGVTWNPSYRIDLSDPDTALLSAKALVINEVMDLDGVRLELVTGFPNIQFGDVRSPIALQEPLQRFLEALTRRRSGSGNQRGFMVTQGGLAQRVPGGGIPNVSAPTYSVGDAGTVSEDLFLYTVEDVTLGRNETAYTALFSVEAPYEHVYTWHVADYLEEDGRYRQPRTGDADEASSTEVWHTGRVVNTLEFPLTTAATEFVKDGRFVGQDVCYYTPPGATTTIRINRAMNVVAEEAEYEVERERNVTRIRGSNYDRVRVRGELAVDNRMDRAIRLEVTKQLSGELATMSPEGRSVKTARGLQQVNPRHDLVWDLQLEPGEAGTLEYEYQVYVRN